MTYIAFLRGINVGGHRPLKMENLRKMFLQLGFKKVETYIQSGNVVFEVPKGHRQQQLGTAIQDQIKETFGYEVPIIIRTEAELQKAREQFPFEEKEGWKGYITFLAESPAEEYSKKLEAQSTDIESFEVEGRHVYSLINKQADAKPKFSNRFIEKELGMSGANRNLRTVSKILSIASSQ